MTVGTEHCRGSVKNKNTQYNFRLIESEGRDASNLEEIIVIYTGVLYASLYLQMTMGGFTVLGNIDRMYRS